MKTNTVTILGKSYHMALTCEAMFRIKEELKLSPQQIIDTISDDSRESLKVACEVAHIFSEEAQSLRGYQGYKKEDVFDSQLYQKLKYTSFGEVMGIKRELIGVVNAGFRREVVDENEETDLVLEELKKKEETASKEPDMS